MITHRRKQTVVSDLLGRYHRQRAVQNALAHAYTVFEHCYPQWTASLFDEHFLAHAVTPLLVAVRNEYEDLTSHVLANAWAAQLTTKLVQRQALSTMALPIAAAFLHLLDQALLAAGVTLSASS